MIAWLFVAVLAASAAAWVLAPLFRDDAASAERVASVLSEAEDLRSQREMALSALRDLEDDRATGKIGDADYEDLRSRLTDVLFFRNSLYQTGGPHIWKAAKAVPLPAKVGASTLGCENRLARTAVSLSSQDERRINAGIKARVFRWLAGQGRRCWRNPAAWG